MKASTTPGHRQWKRSILTGNALCVPWWPFPSFIWNSNTSLGLNLFILIWTIPLGLNVTSATPPFIYSVGPGNQFMLLDPDIFFAPSSVVDSSNLSSPLLISIYSFPCHLKMARKRKCPDDKKPQKPKGDRGGSTHYKQSIGNFKAETMRSVSKKSRGLNLRLYHLEWNIHPGMRLRPALLSVRVQYRSGWLGRCCLWDLPLVVHEGAEC